MQTALEIAFVDTEPSPAVEANVRQHVEKLERLCDSITSCHVYVAAPHQQHRQGNQYEVRIEVRVPGTELAVSNRPGDVNAHTDVHVAVRDAFDAMKRQIKRWKQQE